MSIKAFAATLIILLLLTSYTTAIVRDVASRPAVMTDMLKAFGR